jgi:hypothetical protein
LDGLFEAYFFGALFESDAFGGVAGDVVEKVCEHLCVFESHDLVCLHSQPAIYTQYMPGDISCALAGEEED